MLLNTWLAAAKRHLFGSQQGVRALDRRSRGGSRCTGGEQLESRALLTALVINNSNLTSFVDAGTGTLAITNADLGSHDEIVIERVDIASTVEGISIDLSGVALSRLAIETVNVTAFTGTGIDINLTNVTGTRTIALEDITVSNDGAGIKVNLDNTDAYAVTIEDSVLPTASVTAINGSDISHGVITQNEVVAPANLEGVVLTVNSGSSADDFQIVDNRRIEALNKDAVQVNLTDAPTDGLRIAGNTIGNEPGADVSFSAVGDTFVQPFEVTNNGANGEQLDQFVLDLRPLNLVFDTGIDGQPFTVFTGSDVLAGEVTATLSSNDQVLTVDVTNFAPGETLLFVIDVDRAPDPLGGAPIAAPIFGNDLIGALVTFNFDVGTTSPKQVAGAMIGNADVFNASFFARGAGAALDVHGVNLNLNNSPLTNTEVTDNIITGVAGHGVLFDAAAGSDITGSVDRNTILSGGQDGVRFDLEDSNFTGAVRNNTIGLNSGHGINFQPSVSQSGIVEEAFDGSPIVITSTNHGLQTGDVIVIQGMTNANPNINHPGNGIHTVTRLGNDTFSLDGTSGLAAGISYNAGGAWYVPDFQGGVIAGVPQGPAQGLVTIDVQGTRPEGRITEIQNPGGGGDVRITSVGHGLSSGDRVRVSGATGTLIDGDFKVSIIDADTFSLDGVNAVGAYDKSDGLARWRTNLITGATNPLTGDIVVTSLAHGLQTGDEVRIADVFGNTNANGTHTIIRLSDDTFALQGVSGNGTYATGTGFWTPIAEATFTGDVLTQMISGNDITVNGSSGIYINLLTGTRFEGDIVDNGISGNRAKGIHVESHSYGVGETLPLDPGNPLALPGPQDISFDINIGSDVAVPGGRSSLSPDGNVIDNNIDAGIVIEALDLATGSFKIQGNKITSNVDDGDANTGWAGDGIYVALESDLFPVDANSLLAESVIENNLIGVDNQGNEGNGLNFRLTQRTKIQDLEVVKNFFGNNGEDGFHFERTENGSLNAVLMDDNDVTNNKGDGFDLYAENSVDDRLDFRILRNDVNNNAEYGVRIDVQAAARIEVDFDTNDVIGNGHAAAGNGFHPDDSSGGFAGNAGAAGGVGIFGFEEVEIVFNATDSTISGNIGDGFSIDSFDYRDTLRVDASFTDVTLNNNTLAGWRSHGATFANFDFTSSTFNSNGEDGVRIVAVEDKTADPRLNVRVAGGDIAVTALGNQFSANGQNGALLGQGVSAVFGNGTTTAEFANIFDNNDEDGLKITQDVGSTLAKLGRRRTIETDGNFFRNNGGDGIDIGHDAALEGGNVEHGYEVASDVDVILNNAVITGNDGDGVEYLADSIQRVVAAEGTGQDVGTTNRSSLQVSNSRIESNGQRGVDILNRVSEDSRVTLVGNEILTNTLEGVYVLNTMTHFQTQFGPSDPLVASTTETGFRTPNIELRVQENNILDNGNQSSTSTVPLQFSGTNDSNGTPNADWVHDFAQVTGTLGGLVIRVGTADTLGTPRSPFFINIAQPERELGLSGIDAEVWKNTFNGNFGASVFLDSFVSVIPPQTQGWFHDIAGGHAGFPDWVRAGYRDPLSRLDLVFRENSGNSLDVTNGFAFVDNNELYFKSRQQSGAIGAPNDHTDASTSPPGEPHSILRSRNATRTLGMPGDPVGSTPTVDNVGTTFEFSYEGYGTPTWRVESDYDFNNFNQTSTTQGYSTFHDQVALLDSGGVPFQWDTGRNTSNFIGLTPYSLFRGDVFNVQTGEDPIEADALEENDSFIGATELGVISGTGFSVNDLTNGSLQPGVLNIERKGDRDYYRFSTPSAFASGNTIRVNLGATDTLGDNLSLMIYEVNPLTDVEEVPLVQSSGVPQYTTVTAGSNGFIEVAAKANTQYIVEILSTELSSINASTGIQAGGKSFVYGTVRNYTLSIDAPTAAPPVFAAAPVATTSTTTATATGVTQAVSIPDEAPTVADITDVQTNLAQPINVAVDTISIRFSEDVTGVDRNDFQLTRDGVVLDLSTAIFSPLDLENYEFTNLAPLTNVAGDYVFSVLVDSSGIIDTDGEALVAGGNDLESWTLDNVVDSTVDAIDNVPGDGFITDSNGNRTLRAAVMEANANPGADVISLAPGNYVLSLPGRFENGAATGDLDITESLTIRGTGASALDTVIDAAQIDRVFHVLPGVELILENLTIQGGEAYDGAGLFVEGNRLPGDTVDAAFAGIVSLTDVNVIDNEAYNQGGGIYNFGTVTTSRSSISRNQAGSRGGGIFNHGQVDMINTTISTNVAVSRGGGIYNDRRAGEVNSDISPVQTVASVRAMSSTIAFNSAGSSGGGLYQESGGTLTLGNTIVDSNTAEFSPDVNGTVTSLGFNFIGDVDGTPADAQLLSSDTAADATDGVTDAGLGPLTSSGPNGTWNNSPLPGAFVIDRGSDSLYASEVGITPAEVINERDQVGNSRQIEGDDNGVFRIDIGAVEYFVSQPVAIITATPNPAGVNEVINLSAALSTHTLIPGNSQIVSYEWDFTYDGITFNQEGTGITTTTSYSVIGQYTVALRVTDNTSAQDIETVLIDVDAPSAPIIVAPVGGGTSDSTPTIEWQAGTGNFTLVVTDVSTNQIVINAPGLTSTSYTPTTSLPPGTYSAVVTATNASGSASSNAYEFDVLRMQVLEPAHQSIEFDTTPEFIFTAIPDAVRYQVWVSQQDPDDRRQTIAVPINTSFVDAAGALIPGTNQAMYEAPRSLGEGYFRVWVRAIDANDNPGDWSAGNQFEIVRPEITGPVADFGATIDSTPTITWTDVGANQYEIWLSQLNGVDANGQAVTSPLLVANVIGIQGTSYTPATPLGDGDFRVWVRGLDDNGEPGLWSRQYNFTKNLTVGPTLISPINKVTVTDRTPQFEWQALDGASHYELWVNNITTGQSRVIHNTNVPHVDGVSTITYADPTVVLRNASYRWWVRAFNDEGQSGAWTSFGQFFVPTPVMTAPIGVVSTTNLPTFSWTTVPEYVRFELWVNNLDTGVSRVVYEPNLTTNSFTPTLPLENGNFRVWVRAFDAAGNASQWSNPSDFSVNAAIGTAPQLITPVSFEFDNTPQFEWTELANVTQYEILVKNMLSTGQPTVLNQIVTPVAISTGTVGFSPTSNLSSGTYRWWVRGINADGKPGPWAQPLDFRIVRSDELVDPNQSDGLQQNVMLASINVGDQLANQLRSVTVHPVAVVATITEDVAEQAIERQTEELSVAEEQLDQAMQDLAVGDWLQSEVEWLHANSDQQQVTGDATLSVDETYESSKQRQTGERRIAASLLGMGLAAFGKPRGRRRQDR